MADTSVRREGITRFAALPGAGQYRYTLFV